MTHQKNKHHKKDTLQQEMFKKAYQDARKQPFFADMPRDELHKIIRVNVEQMMKESLKNKPIQGESQLMDKDTSFIEQLAAYEKVTMDRQIAELKEKYPGLRVNDHDEIRADMTIFTVTVMDPDESLFEFYSCSTLDRALTKAKALHSEYFDDNNDTGYVTVEIGFIDDNTEQERIVQWNLDDADADVYLMIVPAKKEREDSHEEEKTGADDYLE